MALAPLNHLLEKNLSLSVADNYIPGNFAVNFYGVEGGTFMEGHDWPIIQFKLMSSDEFDEVRRNYFCEVEVTFTSVLTSQDNYLGYNYEEQIANHWQVSGETEEWMMDVLETTDLENTITGYTNSLKVYDIQIIDWSADIDPSDGVLQSKWTLKIVLFHGTE